MSFLPKMKWCTDKDQDFNSPKAKEIENELEKEAKKEFELALRKLDEKWIQYCKDAIKTCSESGK